MVRGNDVKVGAMKYVKWLDFVSVIPLVGKAIAFQGMITSWSKRMISHNGIETWPRLLREAVVGNFSQ